MRNPRHPRLRPDRWSLGSGGRGVKPSNRACDCTRHGVYHALTSHTSSPDTLPIERRVMAGAGDVYVSASASTSLTDAGRMTTAADRWVITRLLQQLEVTLGALEAAAGTHPRSPRARGRSGARRFPLRIAADPSGVCWSISRNLWRRAGWPTDSAHAPASTGNRRGLDPCLRRADNSTRNAPCPRLEAQRTHGNGPKSAALFH
jgi:hypothetical protein